MKPSVSACASVIMKASRNRLAIFRSRPSKASRSSMRARRRCSSLMPSPESYDVENHGADLEADPGDIQGNAYDAADQQLAHRPGRMRKQRHGFNSPGNIPG